MNNIQKSNLGYNIQKLSTGGIWITFGYETELERAEIFMKALKIESHDQVRIQPVEDTAEAWVDCPSEQIPNNQ